MKSIFTAAAALIVSLSASAALQGDGYYRVQNYASGRYIYVLDNKGSLNFAATTADLGALQSRKGYDRTISDPATVIYVTDLTGKGNYFDLQSQGTGVKQMIDFGVNILKDSKGDFYRIYGEDSGLCRYIGDGREYDYDYSYISSIQPYSNDYIKWYFHPITLDDSQYFGLTPSVTAAGKMYAPFYASFPFTPAAEGMKVWYVSMVDKARGVVVISELEGAVPAATPVLVECPSAQPSGNKISLGGDASAAPAVNMLRGVYFMNEDLSHKNLSTYYGPKMRMLGTNPDGTLGFVVDETRKYLPRNEAFLQCDEDTPTSLRVMNEEEYEEFKNAGIINVDSNKVYVRANGLELVVEGVADGTAYDVYNIAGGLVYSGTAGHVQLPAAGIYLVRVAGATHKLVVK